jgi:hypothetical protein
MRSNRGTGGIELLVMLAILAVLFGGVAIAAAYSCSNKWRMSDLSTDWGFFQGCLVRMPSGRWVPEKNVRDVDLSAPMAQEPRAEIPR